MNQLSFYEPADIEIYIKDKGIVLKEKSLIAFKMEEELQKILAFGNEAEKITSIKNSIIISLYTFLYILHKKAPILAICAIVYKVTTMTPHLIMGENCVISGSMHFVFQSERYTN